MTVIDEPILVTDYDPTWPMLFAAERSRVRNACGDAITRIEHCGSTAVPGMAGKPIVDMLVGVRNLDVFAAQVPRLEGIGYRNLNAERWYLRRRGPPHFNIAVTVDGGDFWRTQIKVRDYLRAHPEEAAAYSQHKRAIFDEGSRTFTAYSQAKASFFAALIERARAWSAT